MQPHFIPLDAVSTRPFDLDSIQIAAPCRADWGAMSGDERSRHCKACAKNVYNLSALTRAQATRLILEKEGNLCVHLHRREDGTVITSDCTVGISSWKQPHRALGKLIGVAVAAILGVFGIAGAGASDRSQTRTLGAPRMMGRMAPVDGEMSLPANMALPKAKAKTKAKKPLKSHAKHSAKPARKPKRAAQHRRHRG